MAFTFLILSWVTVMLRCYVRIFLVKGFGLDDQVMLLCLFLFTGYLSCQIGGAVHGTGRTRNLISDAAAQKALHFWYFCEIFYTTSTSILKIAVGLFFLRITKIPIHVWIVRIIMIVSAMVGTGYTFLVMFQCKPISFWWNLDPNAKGKCLSPLMVTNLTYSVSALNSFADWTFGILPIFIVKDLQMKRRVKVVVASIIALAAIGSTATLIRLPYTASLNGYKGELLYRTTDFAIWTTVEVGIGITAGCIATLRPLAKTKLFQRLSLGSTHNPFSKSGPRSKSAMSLGQPLDNIRPKQHTTTTITAGKADSDEETFFDSDDSVKGGKVGVGGRGGINKNITTTIVREERPPSGNDHRGVRRQFSVDSIDHAERGRPVRVHDSF